MKMGRNLTNTTEPDESTQPVSQTGSEMREEAQPPSGTATVEGPSISPEAPAETAGLSATPRKSQGTQTARIESLKRAIQQGEYRPLPEEIADALIYEMTTEGRPDLAGLENNTNPLDTVRAGSEGQRPGLCIPGRDRLRRPAVEPRFTLRPTAASRKTRRQRKKTPRTAMRQTVDRGMRVGVKISALAASRRMRIR